MSKKKKALIISAIILLLAFPIVAAAISYFSMIRENSFSPADMNIQVKENTQSDTQTDSSYTFTESENGYSVSKKIEAVLSNNNYGGTIRIRLIPSWVKKEGDTEYVCANLGNASDFRTWKKGNDGRTVIVCDNYGGSIVTFVLNEYWSKYWSFDEDEGCFYYTGTAEPGETASQFIENVEISNNVYEATDGYTLKIDVLADIIQSEDSAADKRNWRK